MASNPEDDSVEAEMIPADDAPEKHVRPELILRVQNA